MKKMKTEKFTVTLPSGLKKKVKDQASKEQRNVSNMATVLIAEALEKRK